VKMIYLSELQPDERNTQENRARQREIRMRVASPGIIQSFDLSTQTVTVQLALREKWDHDGTEEWVDVPLLVDVPILFPRAGNYVLTMPVKPGDECLVVFGDNCMDAWWQSGGVQNQLECRRHDLSDGFAIVGLWSQPRVIPGYSSGSAQLRTLDGSSYVEIADSGVNIRTGGDIRITAGGDVKIESGGAFAAEATSAASMTGATASLHGTGSGTPTSITGATSIEGVLWAKHTHSGVETGSGSTGGVNR